MLNTVYRLTEPGKIEAEFSEVDLDSSHVIVRPTYLSICNADQRYYQGTRDAVVLRQKLPMALIHEGIGRVVYDPSHEYKKGDRVVMVPNTPAETDDVIGENYLRSSRFRGSGFDGYMQDNVSILRDRIIPLPDDLDDHVAAFTELVSVSSHAIDRYSSRAHKRRDRAGVWGDGNLAFITALLMKKRFPETCVCVFGKHDYKLSDFVFADEVYNITDVPEGTHVDHAFECVGGTGSSEAVDQIIDVINPEGTVALMGVSEEKVPVNTRMILEKGLTVFGTSRSGADDFRNVLELYREKPEITDYLSNIVGKVIEIKTIQDMNDAFDYDIRSNFGKTVMKWSK